MKISANKTLAFTLTFLLTASCVHAQQPAAAATQSPAASAKEVTAPAATPAATATAVTTTDGGTKGTVPVFSASNNIENSTLYYNSTGFGIGRFPAGKLDVNGTSIMRGSLDLSRSGDATTSSGYPSVPFFFQSSVYNTSTSSAVLPYFQFRSEPTGNNTASTGATMNFMYYSGIGSAGPQETGLYINPNGTLHFAPAQTFPHHAGSCRSHRPTRPCRSHRSIRPNWTIGSDIPTDLDFDYFASAIRLQRKPVWSGDGPDKWDLRLRLLRSGQVRVDLSKCLYSVKLPDEHGL